jgi:hypothetical protein
MTTVSKQEQEVDLIVSRLREELGAGANNELGDEGLTWPALAQAERFWAVTADRPFISKPGTWGRLRGMLLAPAKVVLRKLMRWYIEPALAQQRDFNSSVLKVLTQMNERVDAAAARPERGDKEAPE